MKGKLDPYANLGLRRQLYMESRAMAEYALSKGKAVPAAVIKAITIFEPEFEDNDDKKNGDETKKPEEKPDITPLVKAHEKLSSIVTPASPQTILLLDLEQEAPSIWKFLGPVALVRQMSLVTILSIIGFIFIVLFPEVNTSGGKILEQNGVPLLMNLAFFIVSASMGACFTSLYRANQYITSGTFDPTYQASYWIRYLLGIISGLILATVISDKALLGIEFLEQGILRPLLAILGGFSADLVYTFLNRIIETVRQLFQGSTDNLIKQKAQEAQIKAAAQIDQARMSMVSDLMKVQQELGMESTPEELRTRMNEIMNKMMGNTSQ